MVYATAFPVGRYQCKVFLREAYSEGVVQAAHTQTFGTQYNRTVCISLDDGLFQHHHGPTRCAGFGKAARPLFPMGDQRHWTIMVHPRFVAVFVIIVAYSENIPYIQHHRTERGEYSPIERSWRVSLHKHEQLLNHLDFPARHPVLARRTDSYP